MAVVVVIFIHHPTTVMVDLVHLLVDRLVVMETIPIILPMDPQDLLDILVELM